MGDPVSSALMLGIGVAGSAVSAGSTLMAGDAQADALHANRFNQLLTMRYKAQELKQAGDTALAASQREGMAFSRNKDMLLSKARAAAGASGGGVDDTSVVKTMGGIEQQGEFQKAMALFGGLDRQAGLHYAADNVIAEALQNDYATQQQAGAVRRQSRLSAAGTLLGGAVSAFGKYGNEVFGIPKSEVAASEARLKASQAYGDASYQRLQREIERKQAESDRAWRQWVNRGGRWG